MPSPALTRFDLAVYRAERTAVGYLFLGMALVVFVDVIHRVFSRNPGRLSAIFGANLDAVVVPVTLAAGGFFLARAARLSRVKAALGSVSVCAAVAWFVRAVPQGIAWAPYFGLAVLLWVGLLGASMATHSGQHLALEMADKLWPQSALPWVKRAARGIVAAFSALVAYLGTLSIADHYRDWASGPGAGLIPSVDWPKWAVFLVIPYAFGMIAFRFLGHATGWLAEPEQRGPV